MAPRRPSLAQGARALRRACRQAPVQFPTNQARSRSLRAGWWPTARPWSLRRAKVGARPRARLR
eukprot:6110682-Lingulodinium_polyedra.AAC.1